MSRRYCMTQISHLEAKSVVKALVTHIWISRGKNKVIRNVECWREPQSVLSSLVGRSRIGGVLGQRQAVLVWSARRRDGTIGKVVFSHGG
jgi:hypothetical protein